MEEVCRRFPHLVPKIMIKIDYQSLVKSNEASREISEFLKHGKVMWRQMIQKNIIGNSSFKYHHKINANM